MIFAAFTIRSGETTRLDLTSLGGVPCRFRLVSGGIEAPLTYSIYSSPGALLFRETRPQSGDWPGRLPLGKYEVRIDSPAGGAPWRRKFEIEVRADDANEIEEGLTDWEMGFLEDMGKRLEAKEELTPPQRKKLEQLPHLQ